MGWEGIEGIGEKATLPQVLRVIGSVDGAVGSGQRARGRRSRPRFSRIQVIFAVSGFKSDFEIDGDILEAR